MASLAQSWSQLATWAKVLVGVVVCLLGIRLLTAMPWGRDDVDILNNPSAKLTDRLEAAERLKSADSKDAVEALVRGSAGSNATLVSRCVLLLGDMDADKATRQRAITECFSHKHPQVRSAALIAARRLYAPRRAANTERLIETLLNDPAPQVRATAARTIGQLKVYDAMPALLDSVTDGDPQVQRAAEAAIRTLWNFQGFAEFRGDSERLQEVVEGLRKQYNDLKASDAQWYLRDPKKRAKRQ